MKNLCLCSLRTIDPMFICLSNQATGLSEVRHYLEEENAEEASNKLAKVCSKVSAMSLAYSNMIKVDTRSSKLDGHRR